MASITKRKYKNGRIIYRIRIRKTGYPFLHVTFEDYDEALEWILEHEPKFLEDPQKYMDHLHVKRIYNKKPSDFKKNGGYII